MGINEILDNYGDLISMIGFLIILIAYLWYCFAIIYHFLRFGIGTNPKILAMVFFIGSFILFALVLNAYSEVNWISIIDKIITPPSV